MSEVSDALSSGGSASGISDTTLSDANLGDQMMGGTGDLTGGSGGFNAFNDIANALSGGSAGVGGTPTAVQSASMTPPSAAGQTGGDPTGAASGTQSNTAPGSSQNQNQQQQTGGGKQQDPDYAPPQAVDQLKTLLKQLGGKPPGPSGPTPQAPFALPTLAAGQTGAQSPMQTSTDVLRNLAAGTTPAEARTPPNSELSRTGVNDIGGEPRDITVQQKAAPPAPYEPGGSNAPSEVADAGLPTTKPTQPPEAEEPQASEPSTFRQPPRLLQDIAGTSTGVPTALVDLARVALPLLLPLLMGGGRRGGFRGGRFMRGFGGFGRFGHLHGGQHPMGRGLWPYHHEMHGWHMHGRPPGPGWRPLHPNDAQALVGGGMGGQQGQDPNRPPKETGASPAPPDQTPTSGAIPGVSGKQVDDYTRQVAQGYGINPDIASKFLGQESSYGQATHSGDAGTSFGPFQLHLAPNGKAMGDDFMRDTGLDPRDPRTWKQQVDYAMMRASKDGWSPGWTTTMNKLGLNQWSGITTNRRFAGKMSNQPLAQETRVTPDMLTELPVTSQPMVGG